MQNYIISGEIHLFFHSYILSFKAHYIQICNQLPNRHTWCYRYTQSFMKSNVFLPCSNKVHMTEINLIPSVHQVPLIQAGVYMFVCAHMCNERIVQNGKGGKWEPKSSSHSIQQTIQRNSILYRKGFAVCMCMCACNVWD